MVADEEEAFSETAMHQRILKVCFLNTIQRRHIKQHMKNIEVFEQAFATIKSTTGISDIEEIVKIFVSLEQRNFSLLTYVNQQNRDIESMEIQNKELQSIIDSCKPEGSAPEKPKEGSEEEKQSRALQETLQQIKRTEHATNGKDKDVEELSRILEECRPHIWDVVKFLKEEIPGLVDAGYEGDVPVMKVSPPDERDSQMNHHLTYVEEALMIFRACLAKDARTGLSAQPKKQDGGSLKKPMDIPSAAHFSLIPNAQGNFDDDDDEDEESFDKRPYSLNELRDKASTSISKRRNKRGQPGAGNKMLVGEHRGDFNETAADGSAMRHSGVDKNEEAAVLAEAAAVPPERNRNFSFMGKDWTSAFNQESVIPENAREQFLDGLEVERERGITVKAQTCSMLVRSEKDGLQYLLNLIDTPGHVDFSYEVSRSLHACQGAVLLCDAVQGIQAQTVSTFHQAFEADLEVLCALSKVDLDYAQKEEVKRQMSVLTGVSTDEVLEVSGKTGQGVPSLLEAIIHKVPPPRGKAQAPFKALLFDAYYDSRRGMVLLIAIEDGELRKGSKIHCSYSGRVHVAMDIGLLYPDLCSVDNLRSGQIGFIVVGAKDIRSFRVGETVWQEGGEKSGEPFPGFKPAHPMVYAGIFPEAVSDGEKLETAMQRLLLTDASVEARRDISPVLGSGYRCGFLGLLHLDVFRQRLSREYGVDVLATSPTVPYHLLLANGTQVVVEHAGDFPTPPAMPPKEVEEPLVTATIVLPRELTPGIQQLCIERRGEELSVEPLDNAGERILMKWRLPLAEVITDFFDKLQALSHGFASFDYQPAGYQPVDLVKVGVRLNNEHVDALSFFALRAKAPEVSRKYLEKLEKVIPAQLFDIGIQAVVGGKVVAKVRIKPIRKDVVAQKILSHGHSGDPSRKAKLLERQKEGKKRLREIAKVQVPPEAFVAMVKM
ncbi:unnamed protein product [Symbiodinium sp. KB8]|nr:unnamed protein product [Symbiodinium sp. KB8]